MNVTTLDLDEIIDSYYKAYKRLIILDYDGTLVVRDLYPYSRAPDPMVESVLRLVSMDSRNDIVITSGRDKTCIDNSLSVLPVTIVAENGAVYKNPGKEWTSSLNKPLSWMPNILSSLKALTFHYEGSFVEEKEYSFTWHYRYVQDKISAAEIRQILTAIRSLPIAKEFIVYEGESFIEIKTPGVTKASFLSRWVGSRNYDFVMAVGDGQTNEEIFEILGKDALSIKVGGAKNSAANYFFNTQDEVIPFIGQLIAGKKEFEMDVYHNDQKGRK